MITNSWSGLHFALVLAFLILAYAWDWQQSTFLFITCKLERSNIDIDTFVYKKKKKKEGKSDTRTIVLQFMPRSHYISAYMFWWSYIYSMIEKNMDIYIYIYILFFCKDIHRYPWNFVSHTTFASRFTWNQNFLILDPYLLINIPGCNLCICDFLIEKKRPDIYTNA